MTDDVLFSTERNVGRIRLNRPKAIHALTRDNPARRVTVLHEGSVLAEGSLADVQNNDKVVEVYLGR